MSGFLASGRCFLCGCVFTFAPDLVPSVFVDRKTLVPPDIGGTSIEDAIRVPLCEVCVGVVNRARASVGNDPIPILPGAYEVQEAW